jgi:hypothetical protein|tara:strand:- start:79 stop:780 length:702 start_codon:yes stop_codon:yes gene_type:complete
MATHHNTPVLYSGYAAGYKDLREMPMSINPDYYCIEDDFVYELDTGWTVVKDSGASVAIVADTVGGELAITSAATTDNDGGSVQGNEIFAVAADKNMFFQTRIKNNDVDQSDICVGFTVNFATNPENMLTATDRIVFQVDDGDASINCITEKNGTATTTDSGVDMADDTYVKLGIACSGTGKVEFFVNDKLVATHSTNIPDDENLAIAAMSLSGSASGTRATTIDYLMGARTR